MATLLAVSALVACASAPPPRSATAATPDSARYVYVTGSRLPVSAAAQSGAPQSAAPTQSVTGDDMKDTGRDQLGSALHALLPSDH